MIWGIDKDRLDGTDRFVYGTNMEDLIIVPAGDVNALVKAIEHALWKLDKSWMSFDVVKEKFSWKNSIKKYLEVCYP